MLHHLARAAALAALVAGTLLAPVPALAEIRRSVRIGHADLDLTSEAGRAALVRRVASTADRLCGVADEKMLPLLMKARECAATARASAAPAMQLAFRDAAENRLAQREVRVTLTP